MEVLCFMADNERQSYIDEINRLNQLVSTLTETLNNQSSTINEHCPHCTKPRYLHLDHFIIIYK